jgi:hypothetical protein
MFMVEKSAKVAVIWVVVLGVMNEFVSYFRGIYNTS